MSATLRYYIGPSAANALRDLDMFVLLPFGVKTVGIWQGVGQTRRETEGFSVKLPDQFREAWELLVIARAAGIYKGLAAKGCRTLARNLAQSLGYPDDPLPGEADFWRNISDEPADRARWTALADWLMDRECDRGWLIAGLLGKKALKVKYGVPVAAMPPDKRRWYE